jgi:hypothetical protein
VELSTTKTNRQLQQAVADLLHRQVAVTVGWTGGSGPLVCLTGCLDGLVEVPSGDDAPLSIVVARQDIMVWPEDLEAARVRRGGEGVGFAVEFESGLLVAVDCTE